jgi:photosystem II stability/assembly factor-like uncharacterized protein
LPLQYIFIAPRVKITDYSIKEWIILPQFCFAILVFRFNTELKLSYVYCNMKYLYFLILLCVGYTATSQVYDSSYFTNLRWRMIGPHRGGRTVGAVGVPQQPNVFYIGVNNGGVWRTNDFGRTWNPLFDKESTGSIGDVAVSPSNPDVIYVGTGEGLHRPDLAEGNGMYRSSDAGKTWSHLGLDDAQQIGGLAIDPKNENRLFVAALGHPYGPNKERGIYRTTDGGKTWDKVLYKDENTGAIQVAIDPLNSNIIYAYMWESRLAPWENGEWNGKGSGLYKSIDGGTTWKQLNKGLPTVEQGLGRIGFTIAPSDPTRLYATVEQGEVGGFYRSDDAGESWTKMSSDERYWGRGDDFAEVKVDPKNADIVYTADVVVWKSTDGAKTFNAFKGAPGGDDYHRLWINPNNPDIILIASDQGAVVTVNGGQTFSSWYNQPTAQFYHVSTDNAFPYNVYGAQQESGSVGIVSRSNDGQITFHDWHPVAAEEWGYIAPDPLDPNIIYGGKISRYDKRTGQSQNISPTTGRKGDYRFIRTAPVLFSPIDKKTLYYAGNVLFKTTTGGKSWDNISPDLSREKWDIPANVGIYAKDSLTKVKRRGVIYTVAPSPKDINTIWAGTDDGLIWITKDGGKNWKNITPPSVTSWSKVSMLEASHFDVNTCYAAINKIRLDDNHPHILKTTDGGKTWKEIVTGLPDDPINTIREDEEQWGLLFAGSERSVYVSFDFGIHWQSLRLNMPATSIRDLVIKDNDIVVGTHGRSFWILDDISSLRHMANRLRDSANKPASVIFFKPSSFYRVRWNLWSDTPLPPDEPAGENPPDGALINYYLKDSAQKVELKIYEIYKGSSHLVRKFSSTDTLYKVPDVNIPLYWIRPQQILSTKPGAHRFVWDLHYPPLNVPASYPISAIYMNTAPAATSPWVTPGTYFLTLSVDGKPFVKPLIIYEDPRVKTSNGDQVRLYELSMEVYNKRKEILTTLDDIQKLKEKLNASGNKDLIKQLENIQGNPQDESQGGLYSFSSTYGYLLSILEGTDMPPTDTIVNAINSTNLSFDKLWKSWLELKAKITSH